MPDFGLLSSQRSLSVKSRSCAHTHCICIVFAMDKPGKAGACPPSQKAQDKFACRRVVPGHHEVEQAIQGVPPKPETQGPNTGKIFESS